MLVQKLLMVFVKTLTLKKYFTLIFTCARSSVCVCVCSTIPLKSEEEIRVLVGSKQPELNA